MPKLTELLDAGHIALDVPARDVPELLATLSDRLVDHDRLSDECGRFLTRALTNREMQGSTGIGMGVAMPHAYGVDVPKPILLIARLAAPIEYGSPPDGRPVDLIFLLTGPESAQRIHVKVMARIVRLMHDTEWVQALREAGSVDDLLDAVRAVEARHA